MDAASAPKPDVEAPAEPAPAPEPAPPSPEPEPEDEEAEKKRREQEMDEGLNTGHKSFLLYKNIVFAIRKLSGRVWLCWDLCLCSSYWKV